MQLELTYLYSMEHFFNFFFAQAANSAGAKKSLETGQAVLKCHSNQMSELCRVKYLHEMENSPWNSTED